MTNTNAPALPSWPSCTTRGWRALLLFTGTTLALAVAAAPRLGLGAPAGGSGESGPASPGALASAADQEPASQPERAEGRLWYPVAEDTLGTPNRTWRIESRNYRTLRLDRGRLADLLARAPRQRPGEVNKSEVVVEMPWPDGSFKSFRMEEISIMEPGLKVRCPDLKTYLGQTHDRSAGAHFDWSSYGLHAVVSSGQQVVSIRPYSAGDTQHYIAYDSRDWRPGALRMDTAPNARQAAPVPTPAVSVPPTPPSAGPIEEIAIERRCHGCQNQYKLTFRRDGTASLMIVGVLGVEHTCTGRVTREDFAGLAALTHREGFFDLNDSYYDARMADPGCATTSVVTDGRRKTVHNCDRVGPLSLKTIEDAIDALGEKISWTERRP